MSRSLKVPSEDDLISMKDTVHEIIEITIKSAMQGSSFITCRPKAEPLRTSDTKNSMSRHSAHVSVSSALEGKYLRTPGTNHSGLA